MKYYFQLQYIRLKRHVRAFGLNPYLGMFLLFGIFAGLSFLFFKRLPSYGIYAYPVFTLLFLIRLSGEKRNEFLKNSFTIEAYRKVRLYENLLAVFPFLVALLLKQAFLVGVGLLFVSAGLSFFNLLSRTSFVIPTPFFKRPFEFAIGFRMLLPLFLFALVLCVLAIQVDNFNLGVFSLMLIFAGSLGFYAKPTPIHYVWVYAKNPSEFLNLKIKTAILYSFLLSLVLLIPLIVFYPANSLILLGFELGGIVYLLTWLLGSFVSFPEEIKLKEGLLFGACMLFPPFLLIVLPYFYNKSKNNLDSIL